MLLQLAGLLTAAVAFAWPAHPHHPKALKLRGAQGTVTVLYFTVEFNAQHLTELKPGFDWHAGNAQLKTDVDLTCGDVKIAKGDYKLNVRRGDDAEAWSAVLVPLPLAVARIAVRTAARSSPEAETEAKAALEGVEADLKKKNLPAEVVLPSSKFVSAHADHLAVAAVHYGYDAVDRSSDQPAGGMEFGVRVSFGDLHRELRLSEVFAAKK